MHREVQAGVLLTAGEGKAGTAVDVSYCDMSALVPLCDLCSCCVAPGHVQRQGVEVRRLQPVHAGGGQAETLGVVHLSEENCCLDIELSEGVLYLCAKVLVHR